MKCNNILGVAVTVAAALAFSPSSAYASCEGVCYLAYRTCQTSSPNPENCDSKLDLCLSRCSGDGAANQAKLGIKDQHGQEIVLGQKQPSTPLVQSNNS